MSSLVRLTHIPIVRWWRLANTICLSTNDCCYWCGYKRSAPHCGNPFLTAAAAKGFSGLFTCCQPFPSYELAICRKNIIMTLWPKKVIKPNSTWQAIWNGINHNYYVYNVVYRVEAFLCLLSDSHVSTLRWQHRGERNVPTLCFPCFSCKLFSYTSPSLRWLLKQFVSIYILLQELGSALDSLMYAFEL